MFITRTVRNQKVSTKAGPPIQTTALDVLKSLHTLMVCSDADWNKAPTWYTLYFVSIVLLRHAVIITLIVRGPRFSGVVHVSEEDKRLNRIVVRLTTFEHTKISDGRKGGVEKHCTSGKREKQLKVVLHCNLSTRHKVSYSLWAGGGTRSRLCEIA